MLLDCILIKMIRTLFWDDRQKKVWCSILPHTLFHVSYTSSRFIYTYIFLILIILIILIIQHSHCNWGFFFCNFIIKVIKSYSFSDIFSFFYLFILFHVWIINFISNIFYLFDNYCVMSFKLIIGLILNSNSILKVIRTHRNPPNQWKKKKEKRKLVLQTSELKILDLQ